MTAATKIVVTMLDVGQGSSTFVEIYTGTSLTATALLDLGSERAKTEAGGPSVSHIVKQLKSMATSRIDFFSLSHSDSDHVNLVASLLSNFNPPGTKKPTKPILEIGTVIYGGPRSQFVKHGATNVITAIEKYQPKGEKKPQPLPANTTSYSTTPVFSKDEVKFYLLVGNHIPGRRIVKAKRKTPGPIDWKTDGYSLNTYSLIFVVDYAGWQFVITGDATGATINAANQVIETWKATFPQVAALTMPHHSSEATTFALTGSKRRLAAGQRVSDDAKDVIETFAASMNPKTLHASAEDVGSFRHPSAYTMSYFWGSVLKTIDYHDLDLTGNQHLFNAYFTEDDGYTVNVSVVDAKGHATKIAEQLPPFDDWWTMATQHAIFTNRYYVREQAYDPKADLTATFPPEPGSTTAIPKSGAKKSPPFAVAWAYTVDDATKSVEIERLENRKVGEGFVRTTVMTMAADPVTGEVTTLGDAMSRPFDAAPPTPGYTMVPKPPAGDVAVRDERAVMPPASRFRRVRSIDG